MSQEPATHGVVSNGTSQRNVRAPGHSTSEEQQSHSVFPVGTLQSWIPTLATSWLHIRARGGYHHL